MLTAGQPSARTQRKPATTAQAKPAPERIAAAPTPILSVARCACGGSCPRCKARSGVDKARANPEIGLAEETNDTEIVPVADARAVVGESAATDTGKPDSGGAKTSAATTASALAAATKPVPVSPHLPIAAPLVQRRCTCGGTCPRCKRKAAEQGAQNKLEIGEPDDAYEQEAERVAAAVVAAGDAPPANSDDGSATPPAGDTSVSAATPVVPMASAATVQLRTPAPRVHRRCACGGSCNKCKAEDEARRRIQRKPDTQATGEHEETALSPQRLGPGRALDPATRARMETRFGVGFGRVRVHTDARAAAAAASVDAMAYTVGRDIVFNRGRYDPHSTAGKHLLAHELTHVIQQGAAEAYTQDRSQMTLRPSLSRLPGAAARLQRQADDTGACPKTPTGLGSRAPQPPCAQPTRSIEGLVGDVFGFCADSDKLNEPSSKVDRFVKAQAADAEYIVYGYASVDGAADYNQRLSCHRANAMAAELRRAGVSAGNIVEVVGMGETTIFGDQESNRAAVVYPTIPPERRFGRTRDDPACPKTPTNLGNVDPSPACPDDPRDMGQTCMGLDAATRSRQCASFHFCLDSDVFLYPETTRWLMNYARKQPAKSNFVVHGYASDEGAHNRDYNVRLSCHRAKRVARELMKYGVPPEQIEIAGKGPTTQFPGGPEANRVAFIAAIPPKFGPTPTFARPKTQQEKHAVLDLATARLDTGGYPLVADAYISFWTCGRVPTLRHAIHTTRWHVEGDEGVPVYQHFPFTTDPPISGEAGGRLGLNAAVVSNDVFFDAATQQQGTLPDVMQAMTYLSFFDKVSDEDFGADRESGSLRETAAAHFAGLESGNQTQPDPMADKPAPKCTQIPPQTYKGGAAQGEAGAKVPKFTVDQSGFLIRQGASVLIAPLPRNKASLETEGTAFSADATVTVDGSPQEARNYEVGFVLTLTQDKTHLEYQGGEVVDIGLPVPIRDTDGLKPIEPWYSDGGFDQPRPRQVKVGMSKSVAQEIAMRFEDITGNDQSKLGGALQSAERKSQYQLWLVARRKGAPLDRFSTHFLDGTAVDFIQDLKVDGKKSSGTFASSLPKGRSDPNPVRFSGPTPDDLQPKETTTTNIISACTSAFGKVSFEIDKEEAKSTSDVVFPKRGTMEYKGAKIPALWLMARDKPVDYRPEVTMRIRHGKAPDKAFAVGLVQNMMSIDWRDEYSDGTVVGSTCRQSLPIRDASEDPTKTDPVFMSNEEPELAQLSFQRKQARLKLRDVPGGAAMLDLADNPDCPGKRSGKLTRIVNDTRFRTWVAARFRNDASCMRYLHRIDWRAKYEVTTNPDTVKTAVLEVTGSDEQGRPDPVLTGLANNDCGSDYGAACK